MATKTENCILSGHANGYWIFRTSNGNREVKDDKLEYITATSYPGYRNIGTTSPISDDGFLVCGHYVYFLKFTTPIFVGSSKKLTLGFNPDSARSNTLHLRYALCTSDANYQMYFCTDDVVSDEYQIETGKFTVDESYKCKFTLDIDSVNLKPNTEYVLILYPSDERHLGLGTYFFSGISATISYTSGIVYVDTGTELVAYQCYVDNGTGWDLVTPYIDNGSGWDMYT
jgi:hypothetical protein